MSMEAIHSRCTEDGDCLLWSGGTDGGGRPKLTVHIEGTKNGSKTVQPRRIVWEAANGPIPKGLYVTVTCGNRQCLCRKHMELITKGEVVRRTAQRPDVKARRRLAGLKSRANSTLDMEKVRYIRSTDKTLAEIAAEFGIGETTASAIRLGKRWAEDVNPFSGLGAR